MPIRIVHREDGGVVLTGFGVVTGADLLTANNRIYSPEERLPDLEYQLCDFTNVAKMVLSPEEVLSIAEQDRQAAATNCKQLIAIVAEQEHIYGLSRMRQTLAASEQLITSVFKTRDEAENWLVKQRAELQSYLSLF